jgi:lipid-A-disaccharide synthase
MKYYIIAGEASGDLHGSNLVKSLRQYDPNAEFRVWGGEQMEQAGAQLVMHYRDHAVMGFFQVIQNLGRIKKNFTVCQNDILHYQPDVIIFIDYSGFNLRMAKFAKQHGFRTVYYIAPQIWAWRQYRIKDIKKYLDKVLIILPFEKAFYQKHNYPAEYVGHPILDAFAQRPTISRADFLQNNSLPDRPIIALLPGSRKQEVLTKLPLMLSVTRYFPDYEFVVAGVTGLGEAFYQPLMAGHSPRLLMDQTYSLLQHAEAALVTSGTATLETALFRVPQVVCYMPGAVTYWIIKQLIKIRFISLVNLILDKESVKELIQFDLTSERLVEELSKILKGTERQRILGDYERLVELLGGGGASNRAALAIQQFLGLIK